MRQGTSQEKDPRKSRVGGRTDKVSEGWLLASDLASNSGKPLDPPATRAMMEMLDALKGGARNDSGW